MPRRAAIRTITIHDLMNEYQAYYTITITETINCELAQLVVDPLLHALQVVRYMELAQGGAGRCGFGS